MQRPGHPRERGTPNRNVRNRNRKRRKVMPSEAQVKANRQNAQKSTGPKTEEGKAVAAMNALKHGLTGNVDVVCWEEQADYDRHPQAVLAELQPGGAMEELPLARAASPSRRVKRG